MFLKFLYEDKKYFLSILNIETWSEDKYLGLFSSQVAALDWETQELLINVNLLAGADSADLYFEGSPHTTDFSLDNISLREFLPVNWREQADIRIENLRQD